MKQIEVELTEVETQRLRLAERIKEYRKRLGMTQIELAEKVGRTQSVVNNKLLFFKKYFYPNKKRPPRLNQGGHREGKMYRKRLNR